MGLYIIPRRVAWFDTVPGRVDALATMSLMQMIADAYESAHHIWDDDDIPMSSSSLPNEAQVAVRTWLAYAHFLPPLPRKQLPSPHWLPIQTEASISTVSNSPKTPNRKWSLSVGSLKLPRKRAYSWSTKSISPSRSLLSLSPSKLWRRRRESTTSFATFSESAILSTPPSTPSKSSKSLPVRSYSTPIYKKRPRFPTKIPSRQGSTFDDVQLSPLPESPTQPPSPTKLGSDHGATRTLSLDNTTSKPWLSRSFSSPNLNSCSTLFESSSRSVQKSVLDKKFSEHRPPNVTLWTLLIITVFGYLFFFFLFLGCLLVAISKLFRIFWGTTEE